MTKKDKKARIPKYLESWNSATNWVKGPLKGIIETFVQAFPPVNIDVFDAAFTPVFVLVVCLGVLACCLCRSVTVIVTT